MGRFETLSNALRPVMDAVSGFFDQYNLPTTDRVLVGVSGGKDSIALLLTLREIGFRVIPAVVDLGYAAFDARAIEAVLAELSFDPVVLNATLKTETSVVTQLAALNSPSQVDFVPCGMCSMLKRRLLLELAHERVATLISFGHHQHDFMATMLKDYFVRKYYEMHVEYEREKFRTFICNAAIDVEELDELISAGHVSTMARVLQWDEVKLIRPLALVCELLIAEIVNNLKIRTFGSGCSHALLVNGVGQESKRELVHAELLERARKKRLPNLALLLEKCLDKSGRPKANPRSIRKVLLPGFDSLGCIHV